MTLAFVKHMYYNNAAFKGGHTISLMCLFSGSLIILSSAAGNFLGEQGVGVETMWEMTEVDLQSC